MRTDIKFAWASHREINHAFRIGVGADGSLWVPADFLRLTDPALEQLQQKYGQVVLMDAADGCVYVDSRAVTMNCANTFVREVLELKIASLVKQLNRRVQAQESAGNSPNH